MSGNLPIANLADLAESIGDQPELFAAPDTQAIVVAREYAHTGRWTVQNATKVQRIIAAWLNTGSMRKTADLVGVSRNTVSSVIRILESAGKLEPLKSRFERRRLEVGMETLEWLGEATEARDLETIEVLGRPGWVGVGIVSDKEAAAPPAAVTVNVQVLPAGQADPVLEYERMLRQARIGPVVDVESAVSACNPLDLNAPPPADTVLATATSFEPPRPDPAPAPTPADPAARPTPPTPPAPAPPDPGPTGGGGSPSPAGGPRSDG